MLNHRPDLLTFIDMLEQEGVTCKPNIASTGKMNGFSFQYQGIAFKASQLGKNMAGLLCKHRLILHQSTWLY
jgi:hypothetical protein